MKMVIDIPNFAFITDIKDFRKAVKEYSEGSGFDKAIREALLDSTPLPKGHGDLIDRNEIGLTTFDILLCNGDYKEVLKLYAQSVENAATIIPADEEDDNADSD